MTRNIDGLRGILAWFAACAIIAGSLLLTACGGGFTFSGVGSGGTGVSEGTASGFGSVIVDGVEYDDSRANVFTTSSTGSAIAAVVKLGQRVRVVFGEDNVAKTIEVLPQLAGPVTVRPDAAGSLQVMGQWVQLVLSADDSTRSTITVLSGYSSIAQISTSDDVEVHGSWVFDTGKGAYVLWATRLEKVAALDPVQLGGVVQSLSGATFKLGSASTKNVRSLGAVPDLANGQVVRAWVARSTLNAASLEALRVQRVTLTTQEVGAQDSVRISGLASSFDAGARTVDVQGLRVQLPAEVAVDEAGLSNGQFVSLEVVVKNGRPVAVSAAQRHAAGDELGAMIVIAGVARGVDWNPLVVTFNLRAIDVQASRSVIDSSCFARAAQAEVQVRVQGRLASGAGPLAATRVSCK
jgi:hypothetical protein